MKDIMKDIANEAVDKVADAAKEVMKAKEEPGQNGETTPTKEGEPEKKTKVQKKLSFRRFSFLRKEKKVKEDKQKNGDATPEVHHEILLALTIPCHITYSHQNPFVIFSKNYKASVLITLNRTEFTYRLIKQITRFAFKPH